MYTNVFFYIDESVFKVDESSCTNPHEVGATEFWVALDRISATFDQKKKRTEASSHLALCKPIVHVIIKIIFSLFFLIYIYRSQISLRGRGPSHGNLSHMVSQNSRGGGLPPPIF